MTVTVQQTVLLRVDVHRRQDSVKHPFVIAQHVVALGIPVKCSVRKNQRKGKKVQIRGQISRCDQPFETIWLRILQVIFLRPVVMTIVVFAAPVTACSGGLLTSDIDDQLLNRFFNEYPGAERLLRSRLENVETIFEFSEDVFGGPSTRRIFVKGDKKGDVVDLHSEMPFKGISGRVHLLKDNEVFVLFRRGKNAGYEIAAHSPATKDTIKSAIRGNIDAIMFASFTITGVPVSEYIHDAENITSIRHIEGDMGEELVQIDFVVRASEDRVNGGRLVFDAAHEWILLRIERCAFTGASDIVVYMNRRCRYKKLDNGAWIPETFSYSDEWSYDGKDYRKDSSGSLKSASIGNVIDEQFNLSAYGIGEIQKTPVGRSRWPLLLLFNILLVLCLFFTWLFVLRKPKPQ